MGRRSADRGAIGRERALMIDREKLIAAVDSLEADAVAFLQEIVRTPSITGQEGEVQAVIAAKMRELGLEVDVWEPDPAQMAIYAREVGEIESYAGRPNVVGVLPGTGDGRSLILN